MNSAGCGGKPSLTFREAEKSARGLRRKVGAHAKAYSCRQCGGAHIGNYVGVPHLDARLRRQKLAKIERRELAGMRSMTW